MSKKSLMFTLVVGALLTLSLGLYALVTAVIAYTTPNYNTFVWAYTDDQVSKDPISFNGYNAKKGGLKITYEGDEFLVYSAETGKYELVGNAFGEDAQTGDALKCTAVATTDKFGSKATFKLTIYKQAEDKTSEYIVANKGNMVELAEITKGQVDSGFKVDQVADVDLSNLEEDWTGIGSDVMPFGGTYNGNGHKVTGLNINVTSANKDTYLLSANEKDEYTMSLGLFARTEGATIKALSVENAKITIAEDLYNELAERSNVLWIRAGLVVGFAKNTVINGGIVTVIENEDESTTSITTPSKVSGNVVGFSVNHAGYESGLGGVVGQLEDDEKDANISDIASVIANYNVVVTIANNYNVNADQVGGVVGSLLGHKDNNNSKIENIDVTLTATSKNYYNTAAKVGGVAGYASYVDINDVTVVNVTVSDDVRKGIFNTWKNDKSQYDINKLSEIGGFAGHVYKATINGATVKAASIQTYSYNSLGIAFVDECKLINVCTSGNVTGYYATGLATRAMDSEITYTLKNIAAEGEEENLVPRVAVNGAKLYGWYNAGLVARMSNTNVEGANALVDSTINTEVDAAAQFVNNTTYSAGLVGYMFATNDNGEYTINSLNVKTTIKDGVDMAGLVCYLGNDNANRSKSIVKDCVVTANLNSPERKGDGSRTHKVGGAVATIYGQGTLDHNIVTVNFNKNHKAGYNYGVAMFGGLVARVAGVNVNLVKNEVSGDAYANYTYYPIKLVSETGASVAFYQLLAGGMVGAVAKYNANGSIADGDHANWATETASSLDDVFAYNVSTVVAENNIVNVNITIAYKAEDYVETLADGETTTHKAINTDGFRARALGELFGLIMNDNSSYIALDTNTMLGTVTASYPADTYVFTNKDGLDQSSKSNSTYGIGIGMARSADGNINGGYNGFGTPKTALEVDNTEEVDA